MSEGLFLFGGGGDPWAATTTLDPGRSLAEKLRFGLTGNPNATDASKAIGEGVSQSIGAFTSPFTKAASSSNPSAPSAAPQAPQLNPSAVAQMTQLSPTSSTAAGAAKKKSGIYAGPFAPG